MEEHIISACFADREQAAAALDRLRQAGALCPGCSLSVGGSAGPAALRLAVRARHSDLARQIIRRSGGLF